MSEIGRLADQVAIVTGAGQGLGEGLANRLDREGCKVVVADLNFENAKKVSENLKNAIPCRVDVSNEEQVKEMIDLSIKEFRKT